MLEVSDACPVDSVYMLEVSDACPVDSVYMLEVSEVQAYSNHLIYCKSQTFLAC
jgi:formate hydrogenlyase subunit 6/NADH:ubiquinone oxidoreductase subunit I